MAASLPSAVQAVTLGWDPSPGAIAGYRLYQGGASGVYTNVVSVGKATSATVNSLISGRTYYFAVTAYDTNNLESDYSSPISYTVPVTNAMPSGTMHYDFTYADRAGLLGAGWDFVARTASGASRNTERLSGAVVDYNQSTHRGALRIPADVGDLWKAANDTRNSVFRDLPSNWTSARLKLAFAPTQNYQQASLVAYQDDDNYVQVTREFNSANKIAYVQEKAASPVTVGVASVSATTNLYLRLDRAATTGALSGYYSLDGATWMALGNVTQTLSNPRVGVVVGSSPGGYPNAHLSWVEVMVSNSVPTTPPAGTLPLPWQSVDIGGVARSGTAAASNGVYTVQGAGLVAGTADSFQFVYQPLSADGEMRAQLAAPQTITNGVAGVMIRESLTPGSRYVFMGLMGNQGYRWQRRSSSGGSTGASTSGTGTPPNAWVRVTRAGNTLSGYKSADGTNWTRVNYRSISLATNTYIGFAVSSGSSNTLNRATFKSVNVVP